jgi:hypothetical protein
MLRHGFFATVVASVALVGLGRPAEASRLSTVRHRPTEAALDVRLNQDRLTRGEVRFEEGRDVASARVGLSRRLLFRSL